MRASSTHFLSAALVLATAVSAQQQVAFPADLVGTWSTKSNKTITGAGFYDPVGENLIEPSRTGISYSFTADGHYEEAYYRAISNPQNPACPSGIMQWQHGTYIYWSNGSLSLTPIAVDGRQLLSSPCDYDNGIYTRYNQTELFERYSVYTDPYHHILRLDLYQFNGAPMNPMYIAYQPPEMLPTTTLNPTNTGTGTAAKSTATGKKAKRAVGSAGSEVPVNWKMSQRVKQEAMNPDRWWWVGLTLTGVGGMLYFGPRRMGISV